MTRQRFRVIKSKIKAWRALSEDNDPIGTMCDVMDEMATAILLRTSVLKTVRPHIDTLSRTDNDPEYRLALARIDAVLR